MAKLTKMEGFSYSVSANRSRGDENVYVNLESPQHQARAHFWLTREEAYALAHELQREADWLTELKPQPSKK